MTPAEDLEARVELTCIEVPDRATPSEVRRTERTTHERTIAYAIAKKVGGQLRTSEHYDDHLRCMYGDGYLHVPLVQLKTALRLLDARGVGYDNIDLPAETPRSAVLSLQRVYARRSPSVRINVGKIF